MPSTPKYTAAPIPAQITSATTIIPMILPIELSSSLYKVFFNRLLTTVATSFGHFSPYLL